jgi:23S rRNA pseudouridine1911/1915/1917 synthase
MEVLYLDNHLLIADKPGGLLTQAEEKQPSLQEELKRWLKQKFNKPGNVFLEPIHRLDRPVAGLVLFARTSKALGRLQAAMRGDLIRKWYRAEVENEPLAPAGTLDHFLVHGDHRALVVPADYPGAKRARLHYRMIAPRILEIELQTGRYHQIRVQLAAIGCPIVGDAKYGASTHLSAIALSHERCEFPHPIQRNLIRLNRTPRPASSGLHALPTSHCIQSDW